MDRRRFAGSGRTRKRRGSFFITSSRSLAREVQREIKWQLGELPFGMARFSTELAAEQFSSRRFSGAGLRIRKSLRAGTSQPAAKCEELPEKTPFCRHRFSRPLGRAAAGRLRYRKQPRTSDRRLGAQARGGLSAADFVKCISIQTITRNGFHRLADTAETLAECEGLMAHRHAVRVRR